MDGKNVLVKKIGAVTLAAALLFGFSPVVLDSYAKASRPSIKEVRGRKSDEIKLPIKYERFASKKVRIRISITNTRTGERWKSSHNRKLDSDGRVTIRIKDLDPGTLYSFRARVKKQNGGSYSESSKKRKGSTKLIGQD